MIYSEDLIIFVIKRNAKRLPRSVIVIIVYLAAQQDKFNEHVIN